MSDQTPKNAPKSSNGESTQKSAANPADKVDWTQPATWPTEVGGAKGPEPTRYGDWESNGRCTDF